MSCFIVDDETITAVVDLILPPSDPGHTDERATALARDLMALNTAAHDTRYPNNPTDPDALKGDQDAYRYTLTTFDRAAGWDHVPRDLRPAAAWLKAVDCYLYQCSESDALRAHDLFRQVQAKRDELAAGLIRRIPEYDQADTWK